MKNRVTFASPKKATTENAPELSQKRSWPELWFGDGADLSAFLGMADLAA